MKSATTQRREAQPPTAVGMSDWLEELRRRMIEAHKIWLKAYKTAFGRKERHREQGLWRRYQNRKREYETELSRSSNVRGELPREATQK